MFRAWRIRRLLQRLEAGDFSPAVLNGLLALQATEALPHLRKELNGRESQLKTLKEKLKSIPKEVEETLTCSGPGGTYTSKRKKRNSEYSKAEMSLLFVEPSARELQRTIDAIQEGRVTTVEALARPRKPDPAEKPKEAIEAMDADSESETNTVAGLVELLGKPSAEIEAARALKELRDPAAVQPLLDLARRRAGTDTENFHAAVEALGEIGGPAAVAPLLELLIDECGEPTRYERKPCRADHVLAAVKSIVEKSIHELDDSDLEWMSTLKDLEFRLYVGLDQDDKEIYCNHKIDCESLRDSAVREIERRGTV